MKFLASSDWHIRDDKPRCRVDDYATTQRQRIAWVVDTINQHKCPMFVSGDIFDSGSNSQSLENMMLEELKKAEYPIYSIAGNHDVPYHSMKQLHKSSYWVMVQAGVLQHVTQAKIDGTMVTGFQYGEKIENGTGIMMCHTLVFPSAPPPYLPTAVEADSLLQLDYDVILSGDNHMAFYTQKHGKTLINGGGLLRQTADKKESNPMLYLYEDGEVTAIPAPIVLENVAYEYLLEAHDREQRINTFIERVQMAQDMGLSFKDNMESAMRETVLTSSIEEIVEKAMKGELV